MARQKKQINPELVLKKIEYFCSFQERCIRETEEKLKDWAVQKSLIPSILSHLLKEGFINEERFAKAFAGGKFRVNKWGRQKIEFELHLKGISDELISKAVNEIEFENYHKVLKELILKKQREIKPEKENNIRERIISYVYSKGYEMDLILSTLKELKI